MHIEFSTEDCPVYCFVLVCAHKKGQREKKRNKLFRHHVHLTPYIDDWGCKQRDGETGDKTERETRVIILQATGNLWSAAFSSWGSAVKSMFLKVLLFLEGSGLNHITQIPFIVHIWPVEWPHCSMCVVCVREGNERHLNWERATWQEWRFKKMRPVISHK